MSTKTKGIDDNESAQSLTLAIEYSNAFQRPKWKDGSSKKYTALKSVSCRVRFLVAKTRDRVAHFHPSWITAIGNKE